MLESCFSSLTFHGCPGPLPEMCVPTLRKCLPRLASWMSASNACVHSFKKRKIPLLMQQLSQECAGAHRTGPGASCQKLCLVSGRNVASTPLAMTSCTKSSAGSHTHAQTSEATEQTRELKLSEVNFTLIFQSWNKRTSLNRHWKLGCSVLFCFKLQNKLDFFKTF